jgi:hypothetical protein
VSDPRHKSLTVRAKAASAPTPEQLAAINAHTLREFAADELVVREYLLAHNAIDRDNECFAPALLDEFARTLPTKGVFDKGHPSAWSGTGGPAEGKVFACRTERVPFDAARIVLRDAKILFPPDQNEAVLLYAQAYFVKTPENESFLRKTDAGIGCDVSIGFNGTFERLKDLSGIELQAYRWTTPGEALELSHVWLGAQPGARATKSASREETTMDQNQQIATLTTERDDARTKSATNQKAADTLATLKAALGAEGAKLIDDPTALAKAVTAGLAHRKSLIDALVTFDRHAKSCGDTDDALAKQRGMYESLSSEHLQSLVEREEKRATGGAGTATTGGVKPGDPNSGAPGAGTKDAPADSPAANPLFAPG